MSAATPPPETPPPRTPERIAQRVLSAWGGVGWRGEIDETGRGLIRAAHGPPFRVAVLLGFSLMVVGTILEVDLLSTVAPGPLWEPVVAVLGAAVGLLASGPRTRRWLGPAVLWATAVGAWAISRHAARALNPDLHLLVPLLLLAAFGVFLAPTRRLGQGALLICLALPAVMGWLGWGAPLTLGVLPLLGGGAIAFAFLTELIDGLHGALASYAEEVDQLARFDMLTGVLARRPFLDLAQLRLMEAKAYALNVSLIYVDIDHFKRVNDTQGHEAGDAVLAAVGEALREVAGEQLLVGRLGGEEFALLLLGEPNEARGWAEAVRQQVAQATTVTVSAGVATGTVLDDLLRRADAALYRAKQTGRNRVVSDVPLAIPPSRPPADRTPAAGG